MHIRETSGDVVF